MRTTLTAAILLTAVLGAAVAAEHVAVKRPVDLPPSADLNYTIKARQKAMVPSMK